MFMLLLLIPGVKHEYFFYFFKLIIVLVRHGRCNCEDRGDSIFRYYINVAFSTVYYLQICILCFKMRKNYFCVICEGIVVRYNCRYEILSFRMPRNCTFVIK